MAVYRKDSDLSEKALKKIAKKPAAAEPVEARERTEAPEVRVATGKVGARPNQAGDSPWGLGEAYSHNEREAGLVRLDNPGQFMLHETGGTPHWRGPGKIEYPDATSESIMDMPVSELSEAVSGRTDQLKEDARTAHVAWNASRDAAAAAIGHAKRIHNKKIEVMADPMTSPDKLRQIQNVSAIANSKAKDAVAKHDEALAARDAAAHKAKTAGIAVSGDDIGIMGSARLKENKMTREEATRHQGLNPGQPTLPAGFHLAVQDKSDDTSRQSRI